MSEIGRLLQEKRMEQGLSIEDIQEITKIRKRYIRAIEEGRLEELPGKFYAKAFIKTYAEVVGLDSEILDEHQEALPKSEIESIPDKTNIHSMAKPPSRLGKWFMLSFVYIFIAVILFMVYMFWVNHSTEDDTKLPGDKIEQTRIDTTDKPDDKEEPSKDNNKEPKQEKEIPKPTFEVLKVKTAQYKNRPIDYYEVRVLENETINVQLKFNGTCWFDIRETGPNGKQVVMNTLNAGEETDVFNLDQPLWIHLGNASGADIYINDKKIEAGIESDPKYILIEKGLKND